LAVIFTAATNSELAQLGKSKMFSLKLLAQEFITTFHFRGHEHSIDMILTFIINNNIIIIVKYTHVQYLS